MKTAWQLWLQLFRRTPLLVVLANVLHVSALFFVIRWMGGDANMAPIAGMLFGMASWLWHTGQGYNLQDPWHMVFVAVIISTTASMTALALHLIGPEGTTGRTIVNLMVVLGVMAVYWGAAIGWSASPAMCSAVGCWRWSRLVLDQAFGLPPNANTKRDRHASTHLSASANHRLTPQRSDVVHSQNRRWT